MRTCGLSCAALRELRIPRLGAWGRRAGWEMASQRVGELEVGEEIAVTDYRHVDVLGPDGECLNI